MFYFGSQFRWIKVSMLKIATESVNKLLEVSTAIKIFQFRRYLATDHFSDH